MKYFSYFSSLEDICDRKNFFLSIKGFFCSNSSIDFVCKLKRPSNLPNSLEYTNNQVFQGSVLEDWLMQSLDDHLNNQQQFYNARNSLLTVFY